MAEKQTVVFYVGNHPAGQYLSNVPARILTETEAHLCGYSLQDLVDTGFYAWLEITDLFPPPNQKQNSDDHIQPPAVPAPISSPAVPANKNPRTRTRGN